MKYLIDDILLSNVIDNFLLEMSFQLVALTRTENVFYYFTLEKNYLSIQAYNKTDSRVYINANDNVLFGAIRDYSGEANQILVGDSINQLLNDVPDDICSDLNDSVFPYLSVFFYKKRWLFKTEQQSLPAITTVFWSENDALFSCHSIVDFKLNGGKILYDFNCTPSCYLDRIAAENNLSETEMSLMMFLFDCKKNNKNESYFHEELMKKYSNGFSFSPAFVDQAVKYLDY